MSITRVVCEMRDGPGGPGPQPEARPKGTTANIGLHGGGVGDHISENDREPP